MQRVLLTGATGFLGRELARALLEQDPHCEIWAVVRHGEDGTAPRTRPELLGLTGHPRFHVIGGDIELEGLGLGSGPYPKLSLPGAVDVCFHLAARTEFHERRRNEIIRANLDGTRHLVAFLECLPAFGKLYHVSTTYVSGIGAGLVEERLHGAPRRYANPYEESKHAAESVVVSSSLDWTILRPSILMGHSGTGAADSVKTVYDVLRTFWRLREVLRNKYTDAQIETLRTNPFVVFCRPDVAKNMICLDDVVRLMLEVALRRPPSGTIYHLANPCPTNVSAVIGSMLSVLELGCLTLDPQPPERPRVEEQLINRGIRMYLPYMLHQEATFDQTELRRLIGDRAVDSVVPMTRSLLHFLFDRYLRGQIEAPVESAPGGPVDRLAQVRKYGRGTLAYSSAMGSGLALPLRAAPGFVSYTVKGRTAAMLGDPVCPPEYLDVAVESFFAFCRSSSSRPVAVQVSRPVADALARAGGHCNRMGDEAVIDLRLFEESLSGGRWEKLRRFRNAARAGGAAVREGSYREVSPTLVDRLSSRWLATKLNQRELAYLVRSLPLRDEPGVRKFFAYRGEELVGFVVFDPLYESEELIGYYADVERYQRRPNGIHDLILLEAIRVFREEGHAILSLGLAPLFHLDEEEHPSASALTRDLFQRMRDEVGPVYNFKGVSLHKTYYNPRWEPTYFYSERHDATSDVLDVLSLIGLLAPEAVHNVCQETFDMFQGT